MYIDELFEEGGFYNCNLISEVDQNKMFSKTLIDI